MADPKRFTSNELPDPRCLNCGGSGVYRCSHPEHNPLCDGNCDGQCPIEVEDLAECGCFAQAHSMSETPDGDYVLFSAFTAERQAKEAAEFDLKNLRADCATNNQTFYAEIPAWLWEESAGTKHVAIRIAVAKLKAAETCLVALLELNADKNTELSSALREREELRKMLKSSITNFLNYPKDSVHIKEVVELLDQLLSTLKGE